jgi:hypothetical protein
LFYCLFERQHVGSLVAHIEVSKETSHHCPDSMPTELPE